MQENANNAKHYLENHENEPNKMTSYYHRILLYSYIPNKYFLPLFIIGNGYITCLLGEHLSCFSFVFDYRNHYKKKNNFLPSIFFSGFKNQRILEPKAKWASSSLFIK